jgi:hypothetical protein
MRVHLTDYTFGKSALLSWVVEGSVDGETWTEMDRRPGKTGPRSRLGPFAVSNPVEGRFIRLTQERNDIGDYDLILGAVEFFGTLSQ